MNNSQTIKQAPAEPQSSWPKNSLARLWHFVKGTLGIIFRHPVIGTSIVPILEDGRIVLIRRQDTGQWALPGGMVEWGEDISTTVRRELAEETGLELLSIRRLVGVYSSPERDPRLHSICVAIAADVKGHIKIQDQYEIGEVRAFDITDIPLDKLSFDNGQQLMNYISGQTCLA